MNNIKYQYVTDHSKSNPEYCITIATSISKDEQGLYSCEWIATFKHPKDRFEKKIARQAIAEHLTNDQYLFRGTIKLGRHYTRQSIIDKIFAFMYYNEQGLTSDYRMFIQHLLSFMWID